MIFDHTCSARRNSGTLPPLKSNLCEIVFFLRPCCCRCRDAAADVTKPCSIDDTPPYRVRFYVLFKYKEKPAPVCNRLVQVFSLYLATRANNARVFFDSEPRGWSTPNSLKPTVATATCVVRFCGVSSCGERFDKPNLL